LLQQYGVISLEDVQACNLIRNRHLAKSISAASWAAFRSILTSTAAYAGTWVIAVPAQYTSQDGSGVLVDARREPLWAAGRQEPVGAHPCPLSVPSVAWCSTATRTRPAPFCGPGRRQRGPLGRASSEQPRIEPWGACHQSALPRAQWIVGCPTRICLMRNSGNLTDSRCRLFDTARGSSHTDARDRQEMAFEGERTPARADLLSTRGLPGPNRSGGSAAVGVPGRPASAPKTRCR
jgi:hypothetical protein